MTVWFARAKTKKAPARGTLEVAINNEHSYEHNNHNSYFSIFFHILQFRHNVSSKSSSTNLPWSVIHLGFAKCICSDCKINLPLLKSVFLQIVKCICRRLLIYFQPTSSGPLICDNHLAGVVSASKSLETCAFFPQVIPSVSVCIQIHLHLYLFCICICICIVICICIWICSYLFCICKQNTGILLHLRSHKFPQVYTRVDKYLPWIKENMKKIEFHAMDASKGHYFALSHCVLLICFGFLWSLRHGIVARGENARQDLENVKIQKSPIFRLLYLNDSEVEIFDKADARLVCRLSIKGRSRANWSAGIRLLKNI